MFSDICYPRLPPASTSTFIVFTPGVLHTIKTRIKQSGEGEAMGSGERRLGVGRRDRDKRDMIRFEEGGTVAATDDYGRRWPWWL